ncbi:hypothetical protein FKP32DRAFT_1378095 [Trametes sanguinea]|nr:hypothetical protein FKP32DRAFT_1378095 [Trametes sanguinea]
MPRHERQNTVSCSNFILVSTFQNGRCSGQIGQDGPPLCRLPFSTLSRLLPTVGYRHRVSTPRPASLAACRVRTFAPYQASSISCCEIHVFKSCTVPSAAPNEEHGGVTGSQQALVCPSPDAERPSPATVPRAAAGICDGCQTISHLGTICSPYIVQVVAMRTHGRSSTREATRSGARTDLATSSLCGHSS